jgi:hypothetical protein
MDSMNDLDCELSRALQVDPAADFAARVRAEIAAQPGPSRWRVPTLALSAIGGAVLIILGTNLAPQVPGRPVAGQVSVLPHQDRGALAPLVASAGSESPQRAANRRTTAAPAIDVLVSPSEMLALQRLFSGATVAPPPSTPAADELSIPELAIEPILLPAMTEGDRQ